MSIPAHDRIPEAALDWLREGKGAALATVIETWGSAPRPRGSQLAISSEAEMAGSVSGGCVEGAVVAEALEALGDGVPRVLEYGVTDEEAFAVGLACGGTIRVLVEPLGVGDGPDADLIARLAAARAERRPVVYAVRPDTWQRRLIDGPGDPLWNEARGASRLRSVGFRRRLVPRRAQSAAADGRGRRGPHRPGAGADGAAGRLRRGGGGSARGFRERGAVSRGAC